MTFIRIIKKVKPFFFKKLFLVSGLFILIALRHDIIYALVSHGLSRLMLLRVCFEKLVSLAESEIP